MKKEMKRLRDRRIDNNPTPIEKEYAKQYAELLLNRDDNRQEIRDLKNVAKGFCTAVDYFLDQGREKSFREWLRMAGDEVIFSTLDELVRESEDEEMNGFIEDFVDIRLALLDEYAHLDEEYNELLEEDERDEEYLMQLIHKLGKLSEWISQAESMEDEFRGSDIFDTERWKRMGVYV